MGWDHNEEELNNAIASMDISAAEIKEGENDSTQKKMDPILVSLVHVVSLNVKFYLCWISIFFTQIIPPPKKNRLYALQ